jgi:hypothetical protein
MAGVSRSLDECPAVVAFFHSAPGLACLHRLVLALHLVCVEMGACGIRLVCLLLQLTGLNRCVGASYGMQHQVNRHVEEAIVAYRRTESTRLAHEMPRKDIMLPQHETFTDGLCLVGIEPMSHDIYCLTCLTNRLSGPNVPMGPTTATIRPHLTAPVMMPTISASKPK